MERETPMTVRELIDALGRFPSDAPVFADGEFTQAVVGAEAAKVKPEDDSLSGYGADYSDDVPNAVLLR